MINLTDEERRRVHLAGQIARGLRYRQLRDAIELTELEIKRRESNIEEEQKLLQSARDRVMSLIAEKVIRRSRR